MTTQSIEAAALSPRQAEIAQLVVSGKSTREIAFALTLSPRTVETHIAAIYNKYGVSSRTEFLLAVLGPSAQGGASVTLPSADVAKTNLPVRRGRLVGRARDIENIVGLVRANQLVTLTGAGGIGKTQAALAVGEALLGNFRDGVWLAELAPLAHGSAVAEALARARKIEPTQNAALIDALVADLQHKLVLLVIDNCEHVIGDVATLADTLLRSCARLHILATSREPLRIAGEQTYRLPSLAVPDAVELFAQRAQAADCRFALAVDSAPIVAEICRKIDGIPLAIELAAARVNVVPLAVLATTIDSHLRILAGGDRLALPRHQTMHALIDWSYRLLSPAEQKLFECMSVFAGGCALEQAAAVYSDQRDDAFTLLNVLASLVDKSLLVVDLESGEPRYALLQSFGHYASEKLEMRGESSAMRQRHATAYTALAEQLEQEYDLAPSEAWYARAEIEYENFQSALDSTLAARRDVELGQRLAAAARPVWLSAGGGQRWLQIARDLSDDRTPPSLVARLDNAAAWSGFVAGEFQAALATGCRLMTVYREFGDPLGVAYAQSLAVLALLPLGRLGEAEPFLTAALEIARAHQRAPLIALLLRAESLLSSLRGELDQSREKLVEALAIYERIGTDRHAAFIIGSLAELEFRVGNVQRAFELATKGVNLLRAQGSRQMVQGLINIAAYSIALNRWDRASANAGEALSLAREAQDIMGTTVALEHLAAVAVLAPSNDSTSDRSEPGPAPAFATAILTPLDPSCSRLTRAALLLGYVDACAVNLGVPREYTEQQEFDRVLASLRVTVHADELAQIMAHGAMLTLEGAIELALSLNV